ncbi:hypothetical protein BDN67DRAFT_985611, partial [Paxillus ammoniavirescens]
MPYPLLLAWSWYLLRLVSPTSVVTVHAGPASSRDSWHAASMSLVNWASPLSLPRVLPEDEAPAWHSTGVSALSNTGSMGTWEVQALCCAPAIVNAVSSWCNQDKTVAEMELIGSEGMGGGNTPGGACPGGQSHTNNNKQHKNSYGHTIDLHGHQTDRGKGSVPRCRSGWWLTKIERVSLEKVQDLASMGQSLGTGLGQSQGPGLGVTPAHSACSSGVWSSNISHTHCISPSAVHLTVMPRRSLTCCRRRVSWHSIFDVHVDPITVTSHYLVFWHSLSTSSTLSATMQLFLVLNPFCNMLGNNLTTSVTALPASDLELLVRLAIRLTSVRLVVDCTNCGGAVVLTICQSDKNGNARKPMVRLLLHPCILALIRPTSRSPSLGPAQPAALTSQLPASSASKEKKLRKRGGICVGSFCKRAGALKCAQLMCQSHCTDVGGCSYHGLGLAGAEPAPFGGDLVVDEDPSLDICPPLEMPEETEQQHLDADGFGHEDLRQALKASLEAHGIPFPSYSQPFPSFNDLFMTPPIPPPSSILFPSSSQPPAPSSLQPFPMSNDLSKPPPPKPPLAKPTPPVVANPAVRQPRITQQLDPLWMADLNAHAHQETEDQKVTERRKEMERAAKQRFVLHWYDV